MKKPNVLLQAKNFTVAAIAHFLKGNPTCEQAEIDYRFNICEKCELFTGVACADRRCGCNINDQKIYLNKLAWADQSCPRDKWGTPLRDLVTLCVTSFLRPEALKRLDQSIAQYYPDLKVITVDTRGNLSWGRNYIAKQVLTPYFLFLEDDFIFTEKTNIRILLQILQEDRELGMIGGSVNGAHTAYDFEVFRYKLDRHPANRYRTNGYRQEYVICDYTDNFGLIRKEMFVDHRWDEDLPIHEHISWFYSIYQGRMWRVAIAKDVDIRHERPRPTPEYKQYRKRNFVGIAENKLGLTFTQTEGVFTWRSKMFNLTPRENSENVAQTAEKSS